MYRTCLGLQIVLVTACPDTATCRATLEALHESELSGARATGVYLRVKMSSDRVCVWVNPGTSGLARELRLARHSSPMLLFSTHVA
jgi:hypothetical protein